VVIGFSFTVANSRSTKLPPATKAASVCLLNPQLTPLSSVNLTRVCNKLKKVQSSVKYLFAEKANPIKAMSYEC
jgi:hypothetical protein